MESNKELSIPRTVDDAFVALRAALVTNSPAFAGLANVRERLHELCRCARVEGVTPEGLLVRLKQTMDGLPDFESRTFDEQTEMRGRIVSFAIDAYFADSVALR